MLVGRPDKCSDVAEIRYVSNLTELIECVKASHYCISVDSLPVHLAVFYNKPVFVFAPRTTGTFPESVLDKNGWDTFGSMRNFVVWIDGH